MKKTLLLTSLLVAYLSANAQLEDGSIAPDFSALDLNGVEHSLYADYLDNGKSVLIDFSATWCSPCWGFHQSHVMSDLYLAYGKDGSDEIGVIFVEADIYDTVTENLYGEDVPGKAPTQGDWVTGTPYPIIEDNTTLKLNGNAKYKVGSFPTIYTICEGSKTTALVPTPTNVLNTRSVEYIKSQLEECQTLVGIANHGKVQSDNKIPVCGTGDVKDVVLSVKNLGNNNLTSGHIVLKKDGAIIDEQDYTGDLAQFAKEDITFDDVIFDFDAVYTAELTTINGGTPAKPLTTVTTIAFGENIGDNLLDVLVFTDNNPEEISWEIKNEANEVIFSGGPYAATEKNKRIVTKVTVPGNTSQCHTVVLKDSGNNGWNAGNSTLGHGMIILSGDTELFFQPVEDFGDSLTFNNAFKTTGVLSNETLVESNKFSMFPNPSTGILNFTTQETINVTIVDMTGKIVYTATNVNNGDSIDLNSLQSGLYIATIKGEKTNKVEKIIIK